MSANGISTLPTKEEKQRAKLNLAAAKRKADGNPRSTYDLTLLPTQYDGNAIVDNPNETWAVIGRPWIDTVSAFTFYEAFGTTQPITTVQYASGNKIFVRSLTYDYSTTEPAIVIVNDIQVLNVLLRGHNLVVLDTNGNVLSTEQYDTYISIAETDRLAADLAAVASGNIVVLTVFDASAINANLRSVLNNTYGSTNNNVWNSSRIAHIFIGIKP